MKRKTKAQREEEQIQALQQRIEDMLRGAMGGDPPGEEYESIHVSDMPRLLGAVASAWDLSKADHPVLRYWNFDEWAKQSRGIAEWLYGCGFRADGTVKGEES